MGHDIQGEAEETGFVQPGERKAGIARGSNYYLQLLKGVLETRWNQTFLRGAQPKDKRQWPQYAATQILTGY